MICNICGSDTSIFYEQKDVPVHSVRILTTREEALGFPKGKISLGFCSNCGFISNHALNPILQDYSLNYNPTQIHSQTFNVFHNHLAQYLIEKYDLYNKKIIEIGCGDGAFLELICELGNNKGLGFDPACEKTPTNSVKFIKDFYSESYATNADFICCKMTLEHISDVTQFIQIIHKSIDNQTIAFFQVPDVMRILKEIAFWDIYYEHCSYFSSESLVRLFTKNGFRILNLYKDYADQYLMIEVKADGKQDSSLDDLKELKHYVNYFRNNYQEQITNWREFLNDGEKNVIWGGGSKGVAFLNTLEVDKQVQFVVDIDPLKENKFLAGTGHQIKSPQILKQYPPDRVIIMNPIYKEEIKKQLKEFNLQPEILTV